MIRFKNYVKFDAWKLFINSCFAFSFNYCPVVWMFSFAKYLKRIENSQERALCYLLNKRLSTYEDLLDKAYRCFMNVNILRICVEICKTRNDLNPEFMKAFFALTEIPEPNQEIFGSKNFTCFWASLVE